MRFAFLIIMHKLTWTAIYLAVAMLVLAGLVWITSQAKAATTTRQAIPSIRPQPARKPVKRCLQAITTQRFLISPDGKMTYAGGFTMWTACE